jgi:hypothetical protein
MALTSCRFVFTAKGFDPVTGLGTPRFPVLLALWLLAK